MKTLTKEKYTFPCERWLDTNEDDNEVVRELAACGDLIPEPLPCMSIHLQPQNQNPLCQIQRSVKLCRFCAAVIKYRVTICTGTVGGSGTDASVFLNLIGDVGDTGDRWLVNCKNNVNKFEKGNVGVHHWCRAEWTIWTRMSSAKAQPFNHVLLEIKHRNVKALLLQMKTYFSLNIDPNWTSSIWCIEKCHRKKRWESQLYPVTQIHSRI